MERGVGPHEEADGFEPMIFLIGRRSDTGVFSFFPLPVINAAADHFREQLGIGGLPQQDPFELGIRILNKQSIPSAFTLPGHSEETDGARGQFLEFIRDVRENALQDIRPCKCRIYAGCVRSCDRAAEN